MQNTHRKTSVLFNEEPSQICCLSPTFSVLGVIFLNLCRHTGTRYKRKVSMYLPLQKIFKLCCDNLFRVFKQVILTLDLHLNGIGFHPEKNNLNYSLSRMSNRENNDKKPY